MVVDVQGRHEVEGGGAVVVGVGLVDVRGAEREERATVVGPPDRNLLRVRHRRPDHRRDPPGQQNQGRKGESDSFFRVVWLFFPLVLYAFRSG